jgi:hypothetical protein
MKAKGLDSQHIAEFTGLSVTEIETIEIIETDRQP